MLYSPLMQNPSTKRRRKPSIGTKTISKTNPASDPKTPESPNSPTLSSVPLSEPPCIPHPPPFRHGSNPSPATLRLNTPALMSDLRMRFDKGCELVWSTFRRLERLSTDPDPYANPDHPALDIYKHLVKTARDMDRQLESLEERIKEEYGIMEDKEKRGEGEMRGEMEVIELWIGEIEGWMGRLKGLAGDYEIEVDMIERGI